MIQCTHLIYSSFPCARLSSTGKNCAIREASFHRMRSPNFSSLSQFVLAQAFHRSLAKTQRILLGVPTSNHPSRYSIRSLVLRTSNANSFVLSLMFMMIVDISVLLSIRVLPLLPIASAKVFWISWLISGMNSCGSTLRIVKTQTTSSSNLKPSETFVEIYKVPNYPQNRS